MEPITLIGLIASLLSVAEITASVAMSCRHLQKEFSGALEHIDNISQQTNTISVAIRGICDIFHQRTQAFPSLFQSQLICSISAVDNIVRQIQNHIQAVRTEAETSENKAKFKHLWKSAEVRGWSDALRTQTEALMLLLQVAQM